MENEYIDLVDENNVVIGITDAKTAHIKKQLHRVVGILLFDEVGNIILQSGTKYNLLELSVGGHVQRGENYEEAAHREMFEELEITTHLDHLFTFLPVNNKMGHFWSIFQGEIPLAWEFKQTEEVKNIIRVNFQEFLKKVKNEPNLFTAGVLNIINEYVKINNI
ncbi:MAG: NTP pyrophosphohydrolase [Parcubacteria group bacterium GW2011_GWB1_36_5]|nr:MAG: NTP pyrophosphohydrolase [Parcubacteria group bacterium GW2011_GWB1_36_5]